MQEVAEAAHQAGRRRVVVIGAEEGGQRGIGVEAGDGSGEGLGVGDHVGVEEEDDRRARRPCPGIARGGGAERGLVPQDVAPKPSARAAEPSAEPSSTTISSKSSKVERRSPRRQRPRVGPPSLTGTTTESAGLRGPWLAGPAGKSSMTHPRPSTVRRPECAPILGPPAPAQGPSTPGSGSERNGGRGLWLSKRSPVSVAPSPMVATCGGTLAGKARPVNAARTPETRRSERFQVGDQVVKLGLGQLAQAGDGVGAVGAGQGVAEGLRAAVVEVGVLVVDAPERRRVVARVGVVGLFEADDVDLAVGELGAAVAGVARGLGRPEDGLAALAAAGSGAPSGSRFGLRGKSRVSR